MPRLHPAFFCAASCLVLVGCHDDNVSSNTTERRNQSEDAERGGQLAQPAVSDVAEGKRIAEKQCAPCHAVDRTSQSPNKNAPPLREVFSANNSETVAYRFIEAMRVGHDDMPLFDFDVKTADVLIAYIKSIRAT